jgi:signal transduction histidine kinase
MKLGARYLEDALLLSIPLGFFAGVVALVVFLFPHDNTIHLLSFLAFFVLNFVVQLFIIRARDIRVVETKSGFLARFFYLSLPLFLLFLLSAGLIIYIISGGFIAEPRFLFVVLLNSLKTQPAALLLFIGIFVLIWLIQLYLFRTKVLANVVELGKVRQIIAEGERGAQLLVRRDLELTRANERLRKLDEIKSGFISVVAHQLRTPLSGVKWTINLLLSGDMGALATEQKTFLMKAYESNDRMISLVNDMLGADRIDSGKVRYLFRPVQLVDIIDNVLFELMPQANAKGVVIRFDVTPARLSTVRADPEKLRAVFQNLLENSIKYSRQQGTVEIGLKPEDHDFIEVFIKDEGIGIPKEQQKNIFDRFFRAQNAIKLETDGSGLGLFIVKSIVERHGGRIWFESTEGKGVTFHFTIPVDKTGKAVQEPAALAASGDGA